LTAVDPSQKGLLVIPAYVAVPNWFRFAESTCCRGGLVYKRGCGL
jgi:hypothetical protein